MLSLNQANAACNFQKVMDPKHANIFARALPHDGMPLDLDAIRQFEEYALDHRENMAAALAFLHEALAPRRLASALSQSPLAEKLGGL